MAKCSSTVKGKVVPVPAIKADEGEKVQPHSYLTSTLGQLHNLPLYPWEKNLPFPLNRTQGRPQANLDILCRREKPEDSGLPSHWDSVS